jgi:hypothetical protein
MNGSENASAGEESETEMSPEILEQMEQLDSQFDRMMAKEFNPSMMNTTGVATCAYDSHLLHTQATQHYSSPILSAGGVYIFSAIFTSSLTIYLYLTPMFDLTIAEVSRNVRLRAHALSYNPLCVGSCSMVCTSSQRRA